MKKIYFALLAICAISASLNAQTVPTCSLNPTFIASTKVGVWPDSITNFISGTVGQSYVQNITVKVPKDTAVGFGLYMCFNRFVLNTSASVLNYNLPPGLNFGSSTAAVINGTVNSAPSFSFAGNANNCASIYGTPTVAGTYSLVMEVTAFANGPSGSCTGSPDPNGGSAVSTQTLTYYHITIAPPAGVQELGNDKMALYQNSPNPFSNSTDIKFYVEDESEAIVTVYNTLGAIVSQQILTTVVGENKVTIKANDLVSGTYIYSLKYKNAVTTKRMLVINN